MSTSTARRSGARELDAASLRRAHPPETLGFASTEDVEPLDGTVGQRRATEAIAFGLRAEIPGYNIFATGPVGVGKRTSLEALLHAHARHKPAPSDWLYVHNFDDPRRPIAVALPSGRGQELVGDLRRFLEDARRELTAAFESDTYPRRQREVTEPIEREQGQAMAELQEHARAGGIAVELTPAGIATVPLRGSQPLTPLSSGSCPNRSAAATRQRSTSWDRGSSRS